MKISTLFPIAVAIVLFQARAIGQIKPIIHISGNSDKQAKEIADFELDFDNIVYVPDRDGNESSAFKFDGNSCIKVHRDINPKNMPELTISYWAKPDFDNKRMTVFSHDNGGFDRTMAVDARGGNAWKWTAYCGSPIAGAKVDTNKWSFVTVAFNQKENEILIAVDGKFYRKEAKSSKGLSFFHIGNNPSFGDPYFGLLDDIKIYDVALTEEQILKEFTSKGGEIEVSDQYYYAEDDQKADIVVRVGDIDNLGFGWEEGFDPFCGMNTKKHSYPWQTDPNDYPGTDRIMVVSSYKTGRSDGYASRTKKIDNSPIPIEIKYDKPSIDVEKVVIQMMLDDFQAPVWGTSFQFHVNGKRLTYVEDVINQLKQTGPTGKLVQVGLLPEDNKLFESGSVSIEIDDPITGAGDGFAIDFIQLLLNPKGEYNCTGNISGTVKDEAGNWLKDVIVSANGLKEGLTKNDGSFELIAVPIGMITVSANKSGYTTANASFELERDKNETVHLVLKKKESESSDYLNQELKEKGFVNLYGIHFDSGKDSPKSESENTLNSLADFLKKNPDNKIEIIGHTDSDGDEAMNQDLSLRRAKSVISWLKEHAIAVSKIKATGLGEASPIANNDSPSGKALNRRVEIRLLE
ncbi:OmpA family protein [Aequorivita marina]|uniref:OmpA family protein n=1 Tax=Aequorivita marina TaxID=3073654 RepID=UPI002877154F|nr:OmpA family protein [Aequorivita sp. S2608]MDS1298585.1 OmpA family protein [Aequorivita sp. S2608]